MVAVEVGVRKSVWVDWVWEGGAERLLRKLELIGGLGMDHEIVVCRC
jgi:hypothetical protein